MKTPILLSILCFASYMVQAQSWTPGLPNELITLNGFGAPAPVNLGIGVTSPQSLVHAANASQAATFRFSEGLNNETPSLMSMNTIWQRAISLSAGTSSTALYFSNNANLNFITDGYNTFNTNSLGLGATLMTLTPQGNLGVGVPNPSTQLHTSGGVRLQGITKDNSLQRVMVQDNNGNVNWRDASTLSGLTYTAGTGIFLSGNTINTYWNYQTGYLELTLPFSEQIRIGDVSGMLTNAKIMVGSNTQSFTHHSQNKLGANPQGRVPYAYFGKATQTEGVGIGGHFEGGRIGNEGESSVWHVQANNIGVKGSASNFYSSGVGSFGTIGVSGVATGFFGSNLSAYVIGVKGVANNMGNPANAWAVYADGRTFTPGGVWTSSDARLKKDVEDLSNALAIINRLEAKTYEFRNDGKFGQTNLPQGTNFGFLAQDLEEIIPEAVAEAPLFFHDEDESKESSANYKAVNYTMLIPILTQAIKEQQDLIEQQNDRLEKLEKGTEVTGKGAQPNTRFIGGDLAQNAPNPFSSSTQIHYELPEGTQKATIGVYNMNGVEIQLIQLPNESSGDITIQGGSLKPGMYIYTLLIDGEYFDSKRMVLTSE